MKKIVAKEGILSLPTKEDLVKLTTKEGLVNAKQKLEENSKIFADLFGENEYDLRISYLNYKLSKFI